MLLMMDLCPNLVISGTLNDVFCQSVCTHQKCNVSKQHLSSTAALHCIKTFSKLKPYRHLKTAGG